MSFKENSPIFIQIAEDFRRGIFSGKYPVGEKLPPIRELAIQLNVNPNTIVRVYSELEREGLIFTERTNGKFVTLMSDVVRREKANYMMRKAEEFLQEMRDAGFSKVDVVAYLKEMEDE